MIPDLVFAYLMDYLTPLDYEGGALARHPEGDPSRRIDRALAAEVLSAAALLERLAGSVLAAARAAKPLRRSRRSRSAGAQLD